MNKQKQIMQHTRYPLRNHAWIFLGTNHSTDHCLSSDSGQAFGIENPLTTPSRFGPRHCGQLFTARDSDTGFAAGTGSAEMITQTVSENQTIPIEAIIGNERAQMATNCFVIGFP